MGLQITLRPRAEQDLTEIWIFIAGDSENSADRLLDRFDRALQTLREHPHAGRARPELAPELRSFPVAKYVLFYRPTETEIELVRVRSSYLDIQPDDMT